MRSAANRLTGPAFSTLAALVGVLLLSPVLVRAQGLAEAGTAPTGVVVVPDPDDDTGAKALLSWQAPRIARFRDLDLVAYRIYQSANDGPYVGLLERVVAEPAPPGAEPQSVSAAVSGLWSWRKYRFKVAALYAPKDRVWYMQGEPEPKVPEGEGAPKGPPVWAREVLSEPSIAGWELRFRLGPMTVPTVTRYTALLRMPARWYSSERTNVLLACLLYAMIVIWYISHARRGRDIYIRPIAGIEALDDAIGRATEMGKPILYVAGLSGLGDISTITAMTILGRVARRTAEYETPLLVPSFDPLVMLTAREIVREAYLDAGKPDAYREQDIFFVTDRQFAYVAAVDGIMIRERPAANLYMGYFFAEALILAETGAATGAIQIAGTDADTQIPFFVTACDYCLMGEELYAASAYLSREPMLLAQLKAQDLGKLLVAALMGVGAVAATAVSLFMFGPSWLQGAASVIERLINCLSPAG